MASKIALRVLSCVFAMTSAAVPQQPAGNHAVANTGAARAGINGMGVPQY